MPIPVGRSGNVDGEGGTAHLTLRARALARLRRLAHVQQSDRLRIRVEQGGVQHGWSLRGVSAARIVVMDKSSRSVFAAALAPEPSLAELTNDADSDGTDGS